MSRITKEREQVFIGWFIIICALCIVIGVLTSIYGIWFNTDMVPAMKLLTTCLIVGALSYLCLVILED